MTEFGRHRRLKVFRTARDKAPAKAANDAVVLAAVPQPTLAYEAQAPAEPEAQTAAPEKSSDSKTERVCLKASQRRCQTNYS